MKLRFNPIQLNIIIFFFGLLIIASCKKENSQSSSDKQQEADASLVSSESDGEAEMIFNGVFDDAIGVSNDVGMAGTGIFGRVTACYTITISHLSTTSAFPVRFVIDFGTVGCQGQDGHIRRGKVITEYTNRLIFPGAVATTTFYGFSVDSIKVEGTHKITNTSSNVTTQPIKRQFTADVIDGKLSKPNGNYTEWSSHKTVSQLEGLITPDYPRDDIFKIEGSAHGRVKKGSLLVAWESGISDALIKRFNCRWIVKGTVKIVRVNNTVNSPWVALLDFGTGDCDNKAEITINGVSHNITLH